MLLTYVLTGISVVLLVNSVFLLISIMYSWNDPHTLHLRKSPKKLDDAFNTFTLVLPVRNEANVIEHTLTALSKINYPKHQFEVLVVCRYDDAFTLDVIQEAIFNLGCPNIHLVSVDSTIDSKPKALNIGLKIAKHDIIAVFDAEDEPHVDILNIINTLLIRTDYEVIQSGVQLMNLNTKWYSLINVLEYYFWFKSALHLFVAHGVVPLGGNTVFINKDILLRLGGWDEQMLTEDADMGIRLASQGAKFGIVYDEEHVTREETPATLDAFIKQRTRWNLGFFQILMSGSWRKLPTIKKRILTFYLLLIPGIQTLWIIFFPLTIFANFSLKLPVYLAIFSLLPAYVLLIIVIFCNYGLYKFTKDFHIPYSPIYIFKLMLTFFPYQMLLCFASIRAAFKLVTGQLNWEKTTHNNFHR